MIKENVQCTSITSQYADISVPLKLKPCAKVGNLVTECCGKPVLAFHQCQRANCSCGCEITITQTICIKIPIEYSVETDILDTIAVCKKAPNSTTACPATSCR